VLNIATSAVLARLLSPEQFGAYFLTFSAVSVLAAVAQGGASQAALRAIARAMGLARPEQARAAASAAFAIVLMGAALASVAALLLGRRLALDVFESAAMAGAVWAASVWVVPLALQGLLGELFRAFHDIRGSSVFGGLLAAAVSLALIGAYWLAYGSAQLEEVIILVVAATLLSSAAGAAALRTRLARLPRQEGPGFRFAPADVLPFLVYHLSVVVLAQADVLVIGLHRPQEELATYAAAARLVTIVGVPLWVVNAVVPPVIAQYHAQERRAELERILRAGATWASVPALIVFAAYAAFGGAILGQLFGAFYAAGEDVLIVLSIGQLANVMTGSCSQLLAMTGHQRALMWTSCAFGVLAIAGAGIVAPSLGAVGVAWVWTVLLMLQNLLVLVLARRLTGVWSHAIASPRAWYRGRP
jgi:O-antigen/teichoic acid export membrane protein